MSFADPEEKTTDGRTFRQWTDEDLRLLCELYATHRNEDLALLVGKTEKAVRSRASLLGLYKDSTRLFEMGRENVAKRWARVRARRRQTTSRNAAPDRAGGPSSGTFLNTDRNEASK